MTHPRAVGAVIFLYYYLKYFIPIILILAFLLFVDFFGSCISRIEFLNPPLWHGVLQFSFLLHRAVWSQFLGDTTGRPSPYFCTILSPPIRYFHSSVLLVLWKILAVQWCVVVCVQYTCPKVGALNLGSLCRSKMPIYTYENILYIHVCVLRVR